MNSFLPYGRQSIDDDDVAAVAQALRADMLTTGPLVEEFEGDFARATGASHAVACNSGTAALHLAALALGLGPGDAAIVPTLTFLATANAVRYTGAEVVFADVDVDTGLMTPATLDAAIARAGTARLRAVFPVHLNGQLCDMQAIEAIARRHGLALVEDACHALGLPGIGAATHGGLICFSTHPVKTIATGEGGIVTTADPKLAERTRMFRSHGMIRDPSAFKRPELGFSDDAANPWYYEMHEIGWNYRLPDILCALGMSQLGKLRKFVSRRSKIADMYGAKFAGCAPKIEPAKRVRSHAWHLYVLLLDFAAIGRSRAAVMDHLRSRGIGTQVHYIPIHLQPYYRDRYGSIGLPGAERYYARCLSIPCYPSMDDESVDRVGEEVLRLVDSR